VHTIQTTDASIVCADGDVAHTKCTCTTLYFLLDHFLGLLDCLSCCHYGKHLVVLVLILVAVWGLSNDVGGAAKGSGAWDLGRCSMIDRLFRSGVSIEAYRSRLLYLCAGTVSTCAR
jgi:hypothetical protein